MLHLLEWPVQGYIAQYRSPAPTTSSLRGYHSTAVLQALPFFWNISYTCFTGHGRVFFPVLQASIVAMISFLVAGQDLSEIPSDLSFSCVGKPYGYYADVATNCKVFHICLGDGDVKWSFLCPNQTSFNQVFLNDSSLEKVCIWQSGLEARGHDVTRLYGVQITRHQILAQQDIAA